MIGLSFVPPVVDARRGAVDRAVASLVIHVAGPGGFCVGCLDARARIAPVPCLVARAARGVVETHGVAVWDASGVTARPG